MSARFFSYFPIVLVFPAVFLFGATKPALATDLVGGEAPDLLPPEEAIKRFTLHPDYQINLYASEVEFPLHSPAAMTFDSRGRLWVGNIPTQPHVKPGEPIKDSIIVLEDADRDGVADKHSVFYEGLYLPMGLAVSDGGRTVYATDEPNLVRLRDTDGDGKADEKEIMLQGFGTEDNHHFISAFQWGPDGRLYYGQGLFLNTQVETPRGPVRVHQAAVFRHDPRDNHLEVFANYGWSNPWGLIFDNWGQSFLADASPALNYYVSHATSNFTYPKPNKYGKGNGRLDGVSFTPSGRRPSCGNEFLLSDHFPPEVRGWYVTNQMKGWHGVRWYQLEESGSGVKASQPYGEEQELLSTTDIMFRPAAMQIGPDGALYVLDYYNPIVGHATYSFRDPRHIKTHGRVWRITHKTRPLDWQPEIYGEPVVSLLGNLGHSNYRARYFSRRELQQRNAEEVLSEVAKWVAESGLDEGESNHRKVEALWLHQNFNRIEADLLHELLGSSDHHVRTAALRVLRYWQGEMDPDEVLSLLDTAIQDESQRVRLEALINLSYFSDPDAAFPVAALCLEKGMDDGFRSAAFDVFRYLGNRSEREISEVERFLLPYLENDQLLSRTLNEDTAREMLARPSLNLEKHRKALEVLAGDEDPLGWLLELLRAPSDEKADSGREVAERLLLSWPSAEVREHAKEIADLMTGSRSTDVRICAQAALLRAGIADPLLESESLLAHAVSKAGRGKSPENLHARFVASLSQEDVGSGVAAALMPAIASFPGKDEESLSVLAATADRLADKNISLSFSALEAMRRIPKAKWQDEYRHLVLSNVTVEATPNFKFAPEEFTVKAGSAVQLVFRNPDNQYHNLVIVKPDAADTVGTKADMMAGQPDGLEKHYVPDDPGVLHWTPQLTLGVARSHTLRFFAPEEPGEYPYLCTFPGHWRVMRGVMKVVE